MSLPKIRFLNHPTENILCLQVKQPPFSSLSFTYRQSPTCHQSSYLHPSTAHQFPRLRWFPRCCGWSVQTHLCRCSRHHSCRNYKQKKKKCILKRQILVSNPNFSRKLTHLSNTRKHSANSSSLLPAWSSLSSLTIMTKNSSKSMEPLPEG